MQPHTHTKDGIHQPLPGALPHSPSHRPGQLQFLPVLPVSLDWGMQTLTRGKLCSGFTHQHKPPCLLLLLFSWGINYNSPWSRVVNLHLYNSVGHFSRPSPSGLSSHSSPHCHSTQIKSQLYLISARCPVTHQVVKIVKSSGSTLYCKYCTVGTS